MSPEQKEDIYKLRLQGMAYKAIAKELLLTVDTVKGHCKRHDLSDQVEVATVIGLCLQCKKNIR